jgi:hypothetical protein
VNAIAVHPASGEILVAGSTISTNFPGFFGGAQSAHAADGGLEDGYVARLSADLQSVVQSTYLGGTDVDTINAMAIHPASGEVLVAGSTTSTAFSGMGGAAQQTHATDGSVTDGFVSRLSADLLKLLQSTFVGGNGADVLNALAIHPASGEVVVAGTTTSSNLAGASGAAQAANAGGGDGFIARLTPDLTANDNVPDAFAFTPLANVALQTIQTSEPVHLTGITGAAKILVDGQPGSSYCISSGNDCSCNVSAGFVSGVVGTVGNDAYVCVRHVSSPWVNQVTRTTLHVGGGAAAFIVSTGTLFGGGGGGGCTLDVDGNTQIDALTDGLMLIRAMFGLTGTAVTNNAVGPNATRNTWALIQPYLNGHCGSNFAP